MIKINNLKDIKNIDGFLGTYGYFSLGNINYPNNNDSMWLSNPLFGLECDCTIEDQCFKIFLYKVGISENFLVLSDFSKIPDIAVIDSEKILSILTEELKNYIEEHNVSSFSGYRKVAQPSFQDSGIVYSPYVLSPTNTPMLGNYSTESTKYVTVDSLSSITSKIN